ncbi:MAG TPA: NUDIX domain-containing protein [Candidatus Nitrosocosmicus sp.]|nr:NUDIX domain-containing protein [Candidatus Nitrosocosmicus sp.]
MIYSKEEDECENPIPTVDTIIDNDSRVLFIKRNKEPFVGKMVFPGGFMKKGETAEDAAKREVKEETSLDIELDNILGYILILTETLEVILYRPCLLVIYLLIVRLRNQYLLMVLQAQNGSVLMTLIRRILVLTIGKF